MSIPNLKSIVLAVHARGGWDLTTLAGCGAFTRACAVELHKADTRIVMLKKSAGRTHVVDSTGRRHAADAVLFLDAGKGTSVDLIGNSRTPRAKPSWTPDSVMRYTTADGFAPDYDDGGPPTGDLESRVAALEARINRHLAP